MSDFDYDHPDYFKGASAKVRKQATEVAGMQVRNTAERIGVKHMGEETVLAFRAALELNQQAPADLMGDQRVFMLPRIRLLAKFFMTRFPHHMADALEGAVDGWGELLSHEGDMK